MRCGATITIPRRALWTHTLSACVTSWSRFRKTRATSSPYTAWATNSSDESYGRVWSFGIETQHCVSHSTRSRFGAYRAKPKHSLVIFQVPFTFSRTKVLLCPQSPGQEKEYVSRA